MQLMRCDKLIDGIVYQLYGLTEDEIAIVEGKWAKFIWGIELNRDYNKHYKKHTRAEARDTAYCRIIGMSPETRFLSETGFLGH